MFKQLLSTLTMLSEAETKDTKTGRIHKGDYGTSHEAGDEGVKKQETSRGRGRPKKDADETGEVKSYDTKTLGNAFGGGQKPKKDIGTVSKKHSLKEYIESTEESILEGEEKSYTCVHAKKGMCTVTATTSYEAAKKAAAKWKLNGTSGIDAHLNTSKVAVDEGTTIEKKGGRVHTGSYGTSYEVGDEGVKKAETTRGRGRPKKGADASTGEVKKYDTKSLGNVFGGGKAPKKAVGKVSASNKLKETEALTIKPMPGAQQITDPQGKTLGTADAATANVMKQAAAQGKLNLTPDQNMAEAKSKPDFLDVDKDKNKKESFKKAVKDKEAKKKMAESISFNEMNAENQETAQEMLAELQDDIETFVNTGHCSDKLEAFLKIHGHNKRKITDENSILAHTEHGMDAKPSKFVAVPSNPKPTPFSVDPIQATTDRAGSFIKSIMTPKKTNPFSESTEMKDIQLESWETQLNSLLTEGITVSSSTGQQGAPDSVSVNATDADAQQLLQVLRQAGVGVFGGDQPSSNYGAPMNTDANGTGTEPEMSPTVVDDGDGMMALIKKMTGIQDGSDQGGEPEGTMSADYEDEEGSGEEQNFGGEEEGSEESHDEESDEEGEEEITDEGNAFSGAVAKAKQDGIQPGEKINVGGNEYPVKEEEHAHEEQESCNECGGSMYEGHACGDEQVEEGYANEAGHEELAQLKALLSMGNDMHREKQSQATGNIQKVTMETKLLNQSTSLLADYKKLSGL